MNIELHGFLTEHAKEIAEAIWNKLLTNRSREELQNSAVTVVNDRSYGHNYCNTPFFRVFSDKMKDFGLVIEILKPIQMPGAGMKTFVECILLSNCFELSSCQPVKTEADYIPLSGNFGP